MHGVKQVRRGILIIYRAVVSCHCVLALQQITHYNLGFLRLIVRVITYEAELVGVVQGVRGDEAPLREAKQPTELVVDGLRRLNDLLLQINLDQSCISPVAYAQIVRREIFQNELAVLME